MEYGLEGISLSEQSSRENLLVALLINTAVAYLHSGYYKDALELINRLDDIYYDIRDEHKVIMYNILGEISYKVGKLDDAIYKEINMLLQADVFGIG